MVGTVITPDRFTAVGESKILVSISTRDDKMVGFWWDVSGGPAMCRVSPLKASFNCATALRQIACRPQTRCLSKQNYIESIQVRLWISDTCRISCCRRKVHVKPFRQFNWCEEPDMARVTMSWPHWHKRRFQSPSSGSWSHCWDCQCKNYPLRETEEWNARSKNKTQLFAVLAVSVLF